jgi:hypothetical protein
MPFVLRHQPHGARRRADERVLINVAGRDAGDDEPRAARDEHDPLNRPIRMRILPAPQVVPGGPSHLMLCQASPGLAPAALKTRQVAVVGVGDGEERQTTPTRRYHLDLEPLPDGRGDDLTAGQVKRIVRDDLPDGVTGWCARLEQPMRDDHPPRQPADPDRHRGAGQQEAPLRRRRFRPDQERQAAQVHPPERNITRLIAKNVHTRVAYSGQVYWLIARHASDRRARGRSDHSRFRPARERSCAFSFAPSSARAACRSYRRTRRTSSSSTAACSAAPHRGRTPLSPPAQAHGTTAHATPEFSGSGQAFA